MRKIKIIPKIINYRFTWKDWIAIGVGFGLFLGVVVFSFSRDVSVPYNVWLNGFKNTAYLKGDYVMFKMEHDNYTSRRRLVKLVLCVPGDRIRRVQDSIFCNNKWVCDVLDKDKSGNPLPQIMYDEIISDGYYFLAGTHARSYDSRYFGLVHESKIERELYSLAELLGL